MTVRRPLYPLRQRLRSDLFKITQRAPNKIKTHRKGSYGPRRWSYMEIIYTNPISKKVPRETFIAKSERKIIDEAA